jgi:hypothetical protein
VPYFFRIVEQPDGWWYRRGREDAKWFGSYDEAIEHATDCASDLRPSEVIVHRREGRAEVVAAFE